MLQLRGEPFDPNKLLQPVFRLQSDWEFGLPLLRCRERLVAAERVFRSLLYPLIQFLLIGKNWTLLSWVDSVYRKVQSLVPSLYGADAACHVACNLFPGV